MNFSFLGFDFFFFPNERTQDFPQLSFAFCLKMTLIFSIHLFKSWVARSKRCFCSVFLGFFSRIPKPKVLASKIGRVFVIKIKRFFLEFSFFLLEYKGRDLFIFQKVCGVFLDLIFIYIFAVLCLWKSSPIFLYMN